VGSGRGGEGVAGPQAVDHFVQNRLEHLVLGLFDDDLEGSMIGIPARMNTANGG